MAAHFTIARTTMATHPLNENPVRIDEFLEGRLDVAESRQIELHLETCAVCRSRLEQVAADESYWTEAATHLADDALDRELEMSNSAMLDCSPPSVRDDK